MQLHGLYKLTLLDFPKHLACTAFTGHCNLRCPFCHNAELVLRPELQPSISEDEFFSFLKTRQGILEGVCISGGEPTLQPDLLPFIRKIKQLGFLVKLDTNGTNPAVLEALFAEYLLDYIAMDIKNTKEKYTLTTGMTAFDIAPIEKSIALIRQYAPDYEFRTTVVQGLHTKEDLLAIGAWLTGSKRYTLQTFQNSGNLLAEDGLCAFSVAEMQEFQKMLEPFFEQVSVCT